MCSRSDEGALTGHLKLNMECVGYVLASTDLCEVLSAHLTGPLVVRHAHSQRYAAGFGYKKETLATTR